MENYHGTPLVASECAALQALERLQLYGDESAEMEANDELLGPIPVVAEVGRQTFGFAAEGGHVVALGLYELGLHPRGEEMNYDLDIAPVGDLPCLRELYLQGGLRAPLPASVARLQVLRTLDLGGSGLQEF